MAYLLCSSTLCKTLLSRGKRRQGGDWWEREGVGLTPGLPWPAETGAGFHLRVIAASVAPVSLSPLGLPRVPQSRSSAKPVVGLFAEGGSIAAKLS